MRTPLTTQQKDEIISLRVDGLSYSEIEERTGISKGAISLVINQALAKSPDLNDLRRLNQSLKESKLSFLDAQTGIGFLHQLDEADVHISDLPRALALIQRYGREASDLLAFGSRLADLENSSGKSYKEIVVEAKETVEQLSAFETKFQTLGQLYDRIRLSIIDLEGLRTLQDLLRQCGITSNKVVDFIQQNIQLSKLGFTLETANALAYELTQLDLNPQDATVKLGKLLSKQMSLEQEVVELQTEKDGLEQEIKVKQTEREGLNSQLRLLEEQVKETRRLKDEEERIRKDRQGQLIQEIHDLEEKREKIAATNKEYAEELESTREDLDRAAVALKKMGEEVSKKKPLAVLARIIEEPENELPATEVLESSLAFVQALCTYSYEHQRTISNYPVFYRIIEPLRRNLEDETRLVYGKTQ